MRKPENGLRWQSQAIVLLVVPWTAISVLLQSRWWFLQAPVVAWQTLGISAAFGLLVWRLRAATPAGAATGAVITASLMFATATRPYTWSWLHGGLMPLLAVFVLTFVATKIGKAKKERIGTGESKRGRNAAQVAANLGVAALVAQPRILAFAGSRASDTMGNSMIVLAIAVLAGATADTVSSEIGQVIGGQPRLITTFRRANAGTDGAITLAGTLAGVVAAAIVAAIGTWAIGEDWLVCVLITAGGTGGLIFDSLLGATLERRGWLNNDAVNFLSTMSAPLFTVLAVLPLMALPAKYQF